MQQNPALQSTIEDIIFGMKDHIHPEVLNPRARKHFRMLIQSTIYEALFHDAVWNQCCRYCKHRIGSKASEPEINRQRNWFLPIKESTTSKKDVGDYF